MNRARGFTLIEMIVAVALFAVVMLIAISALLSLVDANRKAQALQSVINNLNIALDGMVRAVREGSHYRCNAVSPTQPNCADGGNAIFFEPFGGNPNSTADDWGYKYDPGTHRLYRTEDGGTSWTTLTSPEVTIDSTTFYVLGASPVDTIQPKVMVVVLGTAGAQKMKLKTTFHIQATAVQRVLDI